MDVFTFVIYRENKKGCIKKNESSEAGAYSKPEPASPIIVDTGTCYPYSASLIGSRINQAVHQKAHQSFVCCRQQDECAGNKDFATISHVSICAEPISTSKESYEHL